MSNVGRNIVTKPVPGLLKKPELMPAEIKKIKSVAVDLLKTLKTEKRNVNH